MANITQDELNKTLWNAADSSRGTVDSAVFKDYVLSLLFYKYMSDLHEVEYKKLKEKYGDDEARIEMRLQNSRFIMPKGASFKEIYTHQSESNIGELLNIALGKIEDANEQHLKGIFTVDFNSESILGSTSQRAKMIRNLLQDFNKIDLTEVGDDILGNAYMYMIEKFGSEAGKKAGEFFTPKQICKLVAKLANPKAEDKICDPTCGSAGLLITAGNEVKTSGSNDYSLYGQEKTGTTYNLARMNMFLHKQDSARLEWGDTINEPKLYDKDGLIKFDVIVANPPFSLDKWADAGITNDKYKRFHRGIPPASKGDYAFITHMIETTKAKEGRVAVVVPHGVLFRGSAEGRIRQAFVDENILDAVIGLPAGLFQTTGIPVAVLVFDKSREQGGKNENRKDILFIDASREFIPGKNQNDLSDENIAKIVDTYRNRKEIEKYSHIATMDEIKENEYNLNIPRYVDTYEEEEIVDIRSTHDEIKKLQDEISSIEQKMTKYLKELDLE